LPKGEVSLHWNHAIIKRRRIRGNSWHQSVGKKGCASINWKRGGGYTPLILLGEKKKAEKNVGGNEPRQDDMASTEEESEQVSARRVRSVSGEGRVRCGAHREKKGKTLTGKSIREGRKNMRWFISLCRGNRMRGRATSTDENSPIGEEKAIEKMWGWIVSSFKRKPGGTMKARHQG